MMSTILLVFCAFSFAGALTLTGALNIIINRLLTVIHSVGQLIAATIGTTLLVTGATSDGKLALLVPAELFKDAYRRMGLDTKICPAPLKTLAPSLNRCCRGPLPEFIWPRH